MKQILEFEKPIISLKEKIAELKEFTKNSEIDLSDEVNTLEKRLSHLEDEIYGNLKPWDRVQMDRHKERQKTLDYIEKIIKNLIEFNMNKTEVHTSVKS